MEKIKITLPIIVEGKYDKNTLKQIFDCTVIVANGFSVFNSKEKQAVIRNISQNGVIVLTDSDAGGKVIRGFLNGIIPKEKIFNVYTPQIEGKERRKTKPSKEGLLGVEGMKREVLQKVLEPFFADENKSADCENESANGKMSREITKLDFFRDGLSGGTGAKEKRNILAKMFALPKDMTANALLEALNIITNFDTYCEKIVKLNEKNNS